MNTGFRIALAAYVLLILTVGALILVLGPGQIPEPAAAYLDWWNKQPQSKLESLVGWLGTGAALLSLLAAVGMAFFVAWSRPLFVTSLIALVIGEGLMDYPILKSPIEYQMDTLVSLLAGGIVAMSYWSPISGRFRAKQP